MSCLKIIINLKIFLLPIIIFILYLMQIYSKYSEIITTNTNNVDIFGPYFSQLKYTFFGKPYTLSVDFKKINETFHYNPIMNIPMTKDVTLSFLDKIFNKTIHCEYREQNLMLIYLLFHDFILFIIIYKYINKSVKLGFIKIFYQVFIFWFNYKRIKILNKTSSLCTIIPNIFRDDKSGNNINRKKFLAYEFFCNVVLIFDFIYMFLLLFFVADGKGRNTDINKKEGEEEDNIIKEENQINEQKDEKDDNNEEMEENENDKNNNIDENDEDDNNKDYNQNEQENEEDKGEEGNCQEENKEEGNDEDGGEEECSGGENEGEENGEEGNEENNEKNDEENKLENEEENEKNDEENKMENEKNDEENKVENEEENEGEDDEKVNGQQDDNEDNNEQETK